MSRLIISIGVVMILTSLTTAGQQNPFPPAAENTIEQFVTTDIPAEFPGGLTKFYEFMGEHIKYPREARKQKIEGKVFIQFIIDVDGTIDVDSVRASPKPNWRM